MARMPDGQEVTATVEVIDGVLVLVAHGTMTAPDMRRLQDQVRHCPDYRDDMPFLADVSQCDLSRLTQDDIRQISVSPSPFSGSARFALVVADDLGFGMARMFELMRGHDRQESQVFRDTKTALRWLAEPGD